MMKMLKKADILLILCLLVLSLIPLARWAGRQPDNLYADITIDGRLERRIFRIARPDARHLFPVDAGDFDVQSGLRPALDLPGFDPGQAGDGLLFFN